MVGNRYREVLPILQYIQTNLQNSLGLEDLAAVAGYSESHYHRMFRAVTGETLKGYVQRLRLEQAAFQLKIRRDSILDIALNCGFHNHETFTRAFGRRFGSNPRDYRKSHPPHGRRERNRSESLNHHLRDYRLSEVQIQRLRDLNLAYIRHLGPYTEVEMEIGHRFREEVKRRGIPILSDNFVGLGHDDPEITEASKIRYDICLIVDDEFRSVPIANGTGSMTEEIGVQRLAGGTYAVARYVGPAGTTLQNAIVDLYAQCLGREDLVVIGLPLMEVFRTTKAGGEATLDYSDLYVPVEIIS